MGVQEETKETSVMNQLLWDNRVISTGIDVNVTGSTAILNGTVPTYYEKLIAEEDALSTPGILSVENNLTVSYPEEYVILSDSEIKNSIESMLLWDNRIDSSKVNVSVGTGIVTLDGNVDAFWKRAIAENIAFSVSGVVDVIDNLNVVWTESYTDERIAEDIKKALKRSLVVNPEDITVAVANGVVTLTGQVSTFTERRIANQKAAFTAGVVDINNQIEII